ncbi:MAG: glycine betaine ABC transporter substrate-binding protein [Candidatus Dactylopiibacterium sp.]|nr:glycine betaine ABC transporter substrate-binding protein [Candidatus Dactylopiibacterium sp.]
MNAPVSRQRRCLLVMGGALALPLGHAVAREPARPPLRVGVIDLSFHRATSAVVCAVLQRMGLAVVPSHALHEAVFEQLRAGEIDMVVSAWLPSSHGLYQRRVEEVVPTREFGLHYEPHALWGVPDYVPESAVSSVTDLLKPEVRERMTPLIQGIGPGAGITRFSIRMMEEYGLSAAGYRFQTGSQDDCFSAFEKAVEAGRWVVVPLWHPQFLHARHRIRELADPRGLLGSVDRAVLLARADRLGVFTPPQLQVLDNIRLSNAIVSQLDLAINRGGQTPEQAAEAWLATHPDALSRWMQPLRG